MLFFIFFFNDTATTEIYTLSLHDALPILLAAAGCGFGDVVEMTTFHVGLQQHMRAFMKAKRTRSEEHTSELQSQSNLVCRLLLEKKKKNITKHQKNSRT